MKIQRHGRLAGVAFVGALALTACGSDDNSPVTPGAGGGGEKTSASGSGTSAAETECAKGSLAAEGSSAQKNAIEEAISSYQDLCEGATVTYNPTGSGAGIKQFNAGQVDFAGSDSALNPEKGEVEAAKARCQGNEAWNLPMVTGPIAFAYNLPGVDKLVITPELAAKIMLGDIKKWDDPAIAAVNPGAKLPSTEIKVFYRSDESGTTENFEKYLAAAAPQAFTEKPAKTWPGKVGEGREKSSGVAEGVKSTEGGVTYVEWSYAKDNKLGIAQVDNGGGPVELTGESVGKAVATAEQKGTGNDLSLKIDYASKEPGAYPMVLVTYEIVCSKGLDAEKTASVKAFLKHFSSPDVQKGLEEIGYAPLPEEVATKVTAAIEAIS